MPDKIMEAVLNQVASEAGQYYIARKFKGAPLPEKQIAVNACAHGFAMGVRWYEKQLTEKESNHE
jgi:hypothetical protein